jgi:hypothetical protein
MLAMLDGSEDEEEKTSVIRSPAASSQRKRKSGEAQLDSAAEDAGGEADLRTKTSKFIRVTSPTSAAEGGGARASAAAAATNGGNDGGELQRAAGELAPPSQDAFDQELFEAADAPGQGDKSSPDFDYGAAAGESAAPWLSEAAARRAKWSARVAPLDFALLDRAARECNKAKVAGNDAYTSGVRLSEALVSYTHAIQILERALAQCGHKGEAELRAWVDLEAAEADANTLAAIADDLFVIRELTAQLHPKTPNVDFYAQMKMLLRQLSSVYANRATCHAKTKVRTHHAPLAHFMRSCSESIQKCLTLAMCLCVRLCVHFCSRRSYSRPSAMSTW